MQFRLLTVIGIVLAAANHGNDCGLLYSVCFPSNNFYAFLFLFISGYFYHEESELHIKKYLWAKTKQLLIPLYVWNFIYAMITGLLAKAGFSQGERIGFNSLFHLPAYSGTQFNFLRQLWFVMPLFIIEAGIVLFRKLIGSVCEAKKTDMFTSVLSFVLGVIGIVLADRGLSRGWSLTGIRILCLIPFYQAGYLYKKYLEKRDTSSSCIYFASVFGLFLIFWGIKTISRNTASVYDILLTFIEIAFWLRVARILTSGLENDRLVSTIADSAFSIMIHQTFGFFLVNSVYAIGRILSDSLFPDFNLKHYYQNTAYIYIPGEFLPSKINYVIAGIGVGLLVKLLGDDILAHLLKRSSISE